MVIASQHAEGQGQGPRQGVKKRLLLHRVDLQGADIAPGDPQPATLIEADLADALASHRDEAAVTTGEAAHAPVGKRVEDVPFASPIRENLRHWRRRG